MAIPNIVAASPDVERRRRNVENALGSLRIEGFEIDSEARAIFDRYIAGDLSIDELMPELLSPR